MKEKIVSVLIYPHINKYEVRVSRQLDRFHVPAARIYSCSYSEPKKVRRLKDLAVRLNSLLQDVLINYNVDNWKAQKEINDG